MQPKMQTLWHLAKPTQTRTKHRLNKRNPKLPNHTTKLQTPLTILRHLTKLMITHAHTKPRRHKTNHRLQPSLIKPHNNNKKNKHKKKNQNQKTWTKNQTPSTKTLNIRVWAIRPKKNHKKKPRQKKNTAAPPF